MYNRTCITVQDTSSRCSFREAEVNKKWRKKENKEERKKKIGREEG